MVGPTINLPYPSGTATPWACLVIPPEIKKDFVEVGSDLFGGFGGLNNKFMAKLATAPYTKEVSTRLPSEPAANIPAPKTIIPDTIAAP